MEKLSIFDPSRKQFFTILNENKQFIEILAWNIHRFCMIVYSVHWNEKVVYKLYFSTQGGHFLGKKLEILPKNAIFEPLICSYFSRYRP